MGRFANSALTNAAAIVATILVLVLNGFLILQLAGFAM
jgi:hypothetical protein